MTNAAPTPQEALHVARPLVEQVGAWLLTRFRAGPTSARAKADTSLVTAADEEADRRLRAGLQAAFPSLPVLSEEGETTWPSEATAGWVVDPLDGTTNFAAGVPLWGVSVAYVQDGRPVAGVVCFPPLGWTVTAWKGGGAWQGERRWQTRPTGPGEGHTALVALCSRAARQLRVLQPWKARVWGAATYDACAVASGQAVLAVGSRLKVWDLAAVWVIVQEAGGVWHPWAEGSTLPFPLRPGMDYAGQSFPMLAAASEGVLHRWRARVRPWQG